MPWTDGKCECCNRIPERGLAGACSSGLGPISIAICHECGMNGAEPKWLIESTIIDCGGREHMRDHWDDGITFWCPDDQSYHSASEVQVTPEQIEQFNKEYLAAMMREPVDDPD
jgi:hypothetical protein